MASTSTSTFPGMRERRPSTSAPISELQGPVGPGFSRPKHKRTFTGFGAGEIKNVEGKFSLFIFIILSIDRFPSFWRARKLCLGSACASAIFTPRRTSWNSSRPLYKIFHSLSSSTDSAFELMCTILTVSCKQLLFPNPNVKHGRSSHHTASRTRRTSRKK